MARTLVALRRYGQTFLIGVLVGCLLWGQTARASFAPSIIKSINYYSGSISVAASFSGDKDVTITAVTVAKAFVLPAAASGPSGTTTLNAATFGSVTSQNISYKTVSVNTTTTVRFGTTASSDAGTQTINYGFYVVEFY